MNAVNPRYAGGCGRAPGEEPSAPIQDLIVKSRIFIPLSAVRALKSTHPVFQRLLDRPEADTAINCVGLDKVIPVLPEIYHLVLIYKTRSGRVFAVVPANDIIYIIFKTRNTIVCLKADVNVVSIASHFKAVFSNSPVITGDQLLEMLTLPQVITC